MKIRANVTKEFDVAVIRVMSEVRYCEDATVNGVEDTDGALIPLRLESCWAPAIELESGRVLDWPEGTTADVHYKVCDAGEYELLDADGNIVAEKNGYVPDMLAVGESGYGDYIIMKIGANGMIEGWETPHIDPDLWGWIAP
jgi:hypothetical protein